MPTLLVWEILMMLGVCDPGIVIWLTPSPKLIPARASVPPSPLIPLEAAPVVHWISPSAYRNITKDSVAVVASIHWYVLVCKIQQNLVHNYNYAEYLKVYSSYPMDKT